MSFEEKYLDVLQNIEFAIQLGYKNHNDLTDYEVSFALEALIEFYTAKERNRDPRNFNLSDNSVIIYELAQDMCEIRIGNKKFIEEDENNSVSPVSINEILDCLKKIKKSVAKWTKSNGRQGYLDFVKNYIPNV